MNKQKKVNPYAKKQKRRRRISRKQWIALLSLLGAVAILGGIVVMSGLGGNSHAGHNHDEEGNTTATDEHGHPVGSHDTVGTHAHPATNLRYEVYTNEDGTFGDVLYNSKNEQLFKRNKLAFQPYDDTTDDSGLTLIYCKTAEYGFTSGDSIYCDDEKQIASEAFHGVLATDGVRVAYCSDDDTKVIVQDIFDKKAYYKEYPLTDVVDNGYGTIKNATLSKDKKTVSVTYTIDEEGGTRRATFYLHE